MTDEEAKQLKIGDKVKTTNPRGETSVWKVTGEPFVFGDGTPSPLFGGTIRVPCEAIGDPWYVGEKHGGLCSGILTKIITS